MNGSGHQRRVSYRLLLLMLWATLLAFAVELVAGWTSHSLCLLAEALHTLVDAFGTLLGLVAVAAPQRTLGKEIWGHGRGEVAGTLLLSAILGFAGISIFLIAFEQLETLFHATQSAFSVRVTLSLVLVIWAVAAVLLLVVLLAARQSKSINSLALKLNIQRMMADAWLTVLVLLGLVAITQGYPWVDPLLATFLVVMVAQSLWQTLHKQLPMLLTPTAIAPEAIAQAACQIEGVTRCTRILSRGMVGRQVWVELHIAIHPEFMVIAQTIGAQVERALRDRYGPVRAQIWLDPSSRGSASEQAGGVQS